MIMKNSVLWSYAVHTLFLILNNSREKTTHNLQMQTNDCIQNKSTHSIIHIQWLKQRPKSSVCEKAGQFWAVCCVEHEVKWKVRRLISSPQSLQLVTQVVIGSIAVDTHLWVCRHVGLLRSSGRSAAAQGSESSHCKSGTPRREMSSETRQSLLIKHCNIYTALISGAWLRDK